MAKRDSRTGSFKTVSGKAIAPKAGATYVRTTVSEATTARAFTTLMNKLERRSTEAVRNADELLKRLG